MCTAHMAECPVCGKEYLLLVALCPDSRPPSSNCPQGVTIVNEEMREGGCPSPVCPNSLRGGCQVM
ncbi:hypothetical protein M440DRAFT_1237878 [Trichoderma longibrachiatum ATCC 18648]|uniref:Uncharacterized protein n=1 Tax=Trichoderma longibrachiatum ATCC 18648 TaxID=983965 RepID=A0A2T4C5P8_TRILO|nr:hypothetical protein M440DRAFT_1237878 [Trichoderma longibrachiatum ATCC 18648]